MANPYDALAAGLQPQGTPTTDNPYDAIVEDIQVQQQARARTVYEKALATNPDQAAESQRLAKQTGLPPDTVERNLADVRRKEQARLLDLQRLATESPVLARQLADAGFTKQAHDDIGVLEQVGQFFTNTGKAAKAGVYNTSKGAAGVFRAGFELAAPVLDPLEGVTAIGGNPLRRLAEGFAMQGEAAGASAKAAAPKGDGNIAAGYYSGIQSLTQNLLALPMAFAPGGQGAALSMMTATTGGQSYQDARDKGLSMSQALPFAASQAAIEYATEKLPLGQLIGDVKAGTGILKTLAKQMALEIPGEQVATVLQDLNEWAILNPEKPFKDYIDERPDAFVQTLVATIVGTGGNVVVAKGIETATRRLMGDAYDAGLADQSAEQLQGALQTAAQSMLRQRNPDEFRSLMQQMAEQTDGAPQEIYIDAEVLNQLAPELQQQLPESVLAQLADALVANDVVSIPVADALTIAPGTPLEQMLIENARVGDASAMSQAEAKIAGEQAQQYLQQEAARVIAQATDAQALRESGERVKAGLFDQLQSAGRFRRDVNEAYATWTTAFYTTMAGRLGISPEEMAGKYPLRIGAQAGQGETLEQGSQRFSEDNRLSNLNPDGASWQRIRESNPALQGKGPDDTVTVYRVTIGDTLRPDDFVAVDKSTLRTELKNVRARDGKAAKIIEQQVRVRDLLMGNDATEFVYFPAGDTFAQSTPQTETPEFRNWFGESKVVDASGKPLVVYHGTNKKFSSFKPAKIGTGADAELGGIGFSGRGFYFTPHEGEAKKFGKHVVAAYVALKTPLIVPPYKSTRAVASEILGYDVKGEDLQEVLTRAGYDGVVKQDPWTPEYVAFSPTQIKSATGNRGTFDPNDPNILNQQARATFNPATLELVLNENADLSSFLHESGHFFLEVMADLSSQPDAPAEVQQDMAALLKWFGVADLQTWTGYSLDQKRKYHERFAESFEQFLLEGKAPSVELQPLFRKFRAWMLNVYKSLKAFIDKNADSTIQLSPEIRQVFDRMLASEAQIAEAEQVAGLLPEADATAEAVEKLTARSLRDLKWTVNARAKEIKKLQKQAAELRKGVEAEVRAEVEQQPIYKAMRWLKKGETVDGEGNLVKAEKGFRLATGALAEMYPESMLARPALVLLKGMTAKEGLHPDIVADMFGYASGDALVRSLIDAEPIGSMIEGMTDQRMLEEHGDLVDDRAIEQAANEAIHNAARAKSLATELKAQADALNPRADTGETNAKGSKITVNALVEAAKQFAANVVARTPLRDLKNRAWQHTAAERRAAKRWQEHTAKAETQEAVKAKQDQMLNHAAAKAAMDAQAEMQKILEFFRRVVKDGNEKTVEKGRDPDVVNAARAILGAYGVAPRGAKTALEYMALVEKNDPAMYAALQPSMQAALNMAQPLDALTMEQLRGLHEEIQGMWHLAKRSRQMEIDGNLIDMDDAETELQDRMQVLGVPYTMPGDTGAVTPREELARKLQHVGSLLRRTEQWAQGMGSEFTKLVFQPVKDAADRYRADRVKYRKAYQALVDQVAPHLPKGTIAAPELGYTFGEGHNGIGMAELLHAILHTGNESNKRKLLLGRKWATENPDGTLDTSHWDAFVQRLIDAGTLTQAHYDFAQGVWDLLEQTKPLAQKTHRDVFGRYFAEVTADSFATPFGTYRGGYVPAQADPRIVQDADLRKLAESENENMAFSFPTTNKGFTKGRVEYNRPLMLDLRTIGQHLDKVLLFAHMEPAVRDVNKLLSRKGVSYSLGRIDPTIYAGMLTPWLNRSAKQIVETPVVGDGGISRVLSAARSRAGMALMFANVSNTLQQLTGFSLAAVKVKPASMLRATAQFIAHPKDTAKTVAEASAFMANRMENEIAAINDAIDQILLDPSLYQKAQAWTQKHAYFMQTAMANTMEPIIWTAAYNDALAEGQSERDAVRHADSVIRTTQGSTLPEDVSRIETGPAYARIFTQFVGYFNMMANTNATALKQIAQETGLKKGAGKALTLVTLGMLIPLWTAEAIAIAMRGGPDDEDDDGYLDDWLAAVFGMGTIKGALAMVPFVGQLANAGINRMNTNPADDRVSLSPAVSLLESAVGVPTDVYKAITDPDKLNKRNTVRDVASAVSIATGLPAYAVARPLGYLAGVADDRIDPTGPIDQVRGMITGSASPESK